MATSLRLSWQEEVLLTSSEGEAIVAGPGARIVVRSVGPEILAAMQCLTPPGEDEELLAESILATGTVAALARWYYHIDQFRQRGLIRRSLVCDGKPLATVCSFSHTVPQRFRGNSDTSASDTIGRTKGESTRAPRDTMFACVLSRFAYVRLHQSELVLESPLAHARIILHDPRLMSILGALAKPCTLVALTERQNELAPGLNPEEIKAFVNLLRDAKMVEQVPVDSSPDQTDSDSCNEPGLASWEFHDLLFHSRSRRGRSDSQFGGTYRFANRRAPPALKVVDHREPYLLYRPDMEQLERDDPPLAQVQERRRSLRQYADQPMTARQLGEFLYRVARVKELKQFTTPTTPTSPQSQTIELASRPFPAGGGLYELEFYIAVKACQELVPGLYHYDPLHHRLGRLDQTIQVVESLLEEAATSAGMPPESLQVLIILTSRFERIAWKYESIAYSLTLKHVGVVYQTMYLAAVAMGLAPCAIGCGDSDLFARVAGTDYYVETSVGEFLLGSCVSEVRT